MRIDRGGYVKRYDEVKIGDVFSYNDLVYIRIQVLSDDNNYNVNAICLINGMGTYFYSDTEVIELNCRLVIEP